MYPYNETIINILIKDNINRFGYISLNTIDYIWNMDLVKKKTSWGKSTFGKKYGNDGILSVGDIENELYIIFVTCIFKFKHNSGKIFASYYNRAIELRRKRLYEDVIVKDNKVRQQISDNKKFADKIENSEFNNFIDYGFILKKIIRGHELPLIESVINNKEIDFCETERFIKNHILFLKERIKIFFQKECPELNYINNKDISLLKFVEFLKHKETIFKYNMIVFCEREFKKFNNQNKYKKENTVCDCIQTIINF